MSDESAEPIEEGAAPEAGTDEPRLLNTMEETAEAMRGFFPDDEPAQEADSAAPDADAGPEALSPEPEAAEPAFQMLVDGEMQTVPLSKLQEAYTGTSTQQPVQPAFTEEQALALRQGNAERQKTDDWANQVRTYLTSPLPDPPPLDLRETDTVEYLTLKDEWNQEVADRQQLQGQLQGVEAQRQQETEQLHQNLLSTEWDSLQKHHPDLKDPARYQEFTTDIQEVAKHYGFKEQEMMGWWDHRQIRMAADALKTVRANSAAPGVSKRVADKPPVLKQAGRVESDGAQTRAYKEARARLRKSGSQRDAAAVFRNFV
jgi:hypothetical protein